MAPSRPISLFTLKITLMFLVMCFVTVQIQIALKHLPPTANVSFNFQEWLRPNADKLKRSAQTKTINQLIPEFTPLIQINLGSMLPAPATLIPHRRYYEKITTYYPHLAEAYALLGFCYHYEGREEDAIAAFQKAAQSNPQLFYSHYDLGVIALNRNLYGQAAEAFARALSCSPEINLHIISQSKIYQQMAPSQKEFFPLAAKNLMTAYADAAKILQLISQVQKNPGAVASLGSILPTLSVRIF